MAKIYRSILAILIISSVGLVINSCNMSNPSITPKVTANENIPPISDTDFTLTNGYQSITLGMSAEDFINAFEVQNLDQIPKRTITVGKNEYDIYEYSTMGLQVNVSNRGWDKNGLSKTDFRVTQIETEDKSWSFGKGIRVGDTFAMLEKQYGKGTKRSGIAAFTIEYTHKDKFVNFISDFDKHQSIYRIKAAFPFENK